MAEPKHSVCQCRHEQIDSLFRRHGRHHLLKPSVRNLRAPQFKTNESLAPLVGHRPSQRECYTMAGHTTSDDKEDTGSPEQGHEVHHR